MATGTTQRRELAHRASSGIEISLFWSKVGNTVTVEVLDTTTDHFFALDVPSERALDAFHHPFVYLAAAERLVDGELLAA
jgi:hypothetical protein